jgi:hypothetical protein
LPFAHARGSRRLRSALAAQIRGGDLNPHFFHWVADALRLRCGPRAGLRLRSALGLDPALTFAELVVSARAVIAFAGTLTVLVAYAMGRMGTA